MYSIRRVICRASSVILAIVALGGLYAISGCESGGGGGGGGSSTVQGNVSRYAGGVVLYMPKQPSGRLSKILAAVGDVLTTPAFAAGLDGVTVTLDGTSLSAVTDANGNFVITGVPAGSYTLVISFNGQSASYPVAVEADNSTVTLEDIQVENGVVSVASVHVVVEAADSSTNDNSTVEQSDGNSGNDSSNDSTGDQSGNSGNSGSGSGDSGSNSGGSNDNSGGGGDGK